MNIKDFCVRANATFRLREAQHHCEAHHLHEVQHRFVPQADNDVLASLEMMLTFGQMMLCLAAQMKKSKSFDLDFLAGAVRLELTTNGFGDRDSTN